MDKTRVEFLSDGVFAIVLTILVIDIKLPEFAGEISNQELLMQLAELWPLFASFALSFLVISVFWINHNYLFHTLTKKVDRGLNLLNLLYLLFVVFIPFVAHMVGEHPYSSVAAIIYGFTILIVSLLAKAMFLHVLKRPELHHELSSRFLKQAHIRMTLTPVSYILGILCAPFFIGGSIFFYVFPMLFNLIPGSIDVLERMFRFELT
ncbi:MAG: Integral membrane protein [Parcubacteria bacterium C7867-008]|nr:MAG: Integral membrane protein [Parcubacteria bacterium C7867-008]